MEGRFLLDANLSPLTRIYLTEVLDLDVIDLLSLDLGRLLDPEVVELAKRESRVIITFDLDFGEIYHRHERGALGVIILRLSDERVESVNQVLEQFFLTQVDTIPLERSLVVLEEDRVRIRTEP